MKSVFLLSAALMSQQSYAGSSAVCNFLSPAKAKIIALPKIDKKDLAFSDEKFSDLMQSFLSRDYNERAQVKTDYLPSENKLFKTIKILKRSMTHVEGSFSKSYSIIDFSVVERLDIAMQNSTQALLAIESALKSKGYWSLPLVKESLLRAIDEIEGYEQFVLKLSAAPQLNDLEQLSASTDAYRAKNWYKIRRWCEGRTQTLARIKRELSLRSI